MCVALCVCVCVCVCDWSGDLEGNPSRQGWHLLHERGVVLLLSATLLWRTHTLAHERQNATHKYHTREHARTHSMQTTLPVAFQMPPGLFLSICGDRMTILPPTSRAEPCRTTHIQEHRTRSSRGTRRLPLQKSSMNLVCLIDSLPANQIK